ncbi:MaoC family dehydratase N-terminal domain-containing protein [Rhodococcus sp. ACT016]|uniref:MaoC family dehydratase N-terminal domain-containing protein n=1 Tax=Rhodococcus sp. ACT016 TaxID=3134808 RepID=UPI003D2A161E
MAIDPQVVGTEFPPTTMTIDAGRLQFFAKAIGETDPVYSDLDAARDAGHRGLPVPPTFLFGVELEQPDPFGWLGSLGVDLRSILHGEQSYTYHQQAYAGDTVTAVPRITDVYTKKGGALEFIVKEVDIHRHDGTRLATMQTVIVVRNTGAK